MAGRYLSILAVKVASRQQPVQEQVDEYEYIVGDYGYPVYSAEARKGGYDDANPYVKGTRDPRFLP